MSDRVEELWDLQNKCSDLSELTEHSINHGGSSGHSESK